MAKRTALLSRLGGAGDILILGPVARELKKRGYVVDGVFGSPTGNPKAWLDNLGLFDTIYKQGRTFNGVDDYEIGDGDLAGIELLKDGYDLVVDYKDSIEHNSHYRHMAGKPGHEWFVSQNSNFVHWVDMMLAWAGIDPSGVRDEDKVPIYKPEEDELKWAYKLLRGAEYNDGSVGYNADEIIIAIQTNASSLVRTWYNPGVLPTAIRESFPKKKIKIIFFDGGVWHFLKGKYDFPISVPKQFDPIRASAALINACNVLISADSGINHLAAAMGVKTITIYTTVPAWTRNKYYKNEIALEPIGDTFDGVQCRPCFVLDRYCPRVREAAIGQLTDRERKIKEAAEANIPPQRLAEELKTTPQAIVREHELVQHKLMALFEQQAPCSKTITSDRIIDALEKELL